jgi:hypothetical protein
MIATVKFKLLNYEGFVLVECDEDESDEHIIIKAKHRLTHHMGVYGFRELTIEKKEDEYLPY